jgi:peptidoglycan L-alanyl-D-glutamate endopeptidase CwlK
MQLKNILGFVLILFLSIVIIGCDSERTKPKDIKSISQDTIIDSNFSWTELQHKFDTHYRINRDSVDVSFQNQWQNQTLIHVDYYSFDGKIHKGQLICHRSVQTELKAVFKDLLNLKFPIQSVIPISEFDFDDQKSMRANNTTCFDFRVKVMGNGWSKHAQGMALDLNPMQNPYIHPQKTEPFPNQSEMTTGRIRKDDEIGKKVIDIFQKQGWKWGGNWRSSKDYMHFEK